VRKFTIVRASDAGEGVGKRQDRSSFEKPSAPRSDMAVAAKLFYTPSQKILIKSGRRPIFTRRRLL
jgi:hypothetical protein